MLFTVAQSNVAFSPSKVKNVDLTSPTSIQFGPDEKLYVSQQNGIIKVFSISRNATNDYSAIATEVINIINQIPNHNDDGSLAPSITTRQVTSILVKGTAANPVLYVTSSDSRTGGSGSDVNLDTNSGILSMLTKVGGVWQKIDLVRGLPRSEENHSTNGIQLDDQHNIMYMAVGGFTNAGSPSFNFAYISEYALSGAILSINLNVINAMATKGSGNNAYKYDLPTLDDPTRSNNADGTDVNDPFGGNDGLNQSKIVTGGPVQVYAPGFRNAYDLVITKTEGKSGRMYSIDNGGNQGWGGYPDNEGATGNVTNKYVTGEPGSTGPGVNDPEINNLDNLHYIGNIATYQAGTGYAGHPNPVRANPAGAGLYTHDGTTGIWRNSKTGANPLPADWPPVPLSMAHPIEGDFQNPGEKDAAILTFTTSVNGIAEYTASNFNNALKGSLLATSYDGKVFRMTPTADGTNVTNAKSATNRLNQELPLASGFGAEPLDITAQGDDDIYPGTLWVVSYGSQTITVFEPQDFINCTGLDNNMDDDNDGYTNADEIDNGTEPCSAASKPEDFDNDNISDLNDPDDDNDGINDGVDYFPLDPNNGLTTRMPVMYNLFNNDPGTGLFGTGLTGLMSNKKPGNDYLKTFDVDNMIAGGAVGAISLIAVSPGDALGVLNNQENGFQFGLQEEAATGPFTVTSRMIGHFFNDSVPKGAQSQGIFIGTGDQSNYVKITLNANGGAGGIEVVYENADVPVVQQFPITGGIPAATLDLYLSVNPVTGTIQPKYASNGGAIINVGSPIQVSGALLTTLQSASTALAVGVISTSRGGNPFTATWDWIYVTADALTSTGSWQTIAPLSGSPLAREENAYVKAGNAFYLVGGRNINPVQAYDPVNKSWSNKSNPPVELNHFQGVSLDGLIYVAGAFTGAYPHETPVPQVYIYNPLADKWLNGSVIPAARRRGAGGAVTFNNKIYLVGGITDGHWNGSVNWFDEYDPATNTWKILPNAPRVRDHFQAAVINEKLYVAGGRRTSGITGEFYTLTIPQVDVYDFASGTWSTLPAGSNLTTPRAGAATAVLGNELLVIGGENAQAAANVETEALNVQTNVWRKLGNLQKGRHATQAIESNNGIYIVAGDGNQGGGSALNSQEAFYLFAPSIPDGTALTQSSLAGPTGLGFGSNPINSDSSQVFTINNTGGNQAVVISSITITGTASFTNSSAFALPLVIPAGKSVNLTVTFKPTTAGMQTANFVITHSGQGGTLGIPLTGDGSTPVYRINAGGGQVINSIGTFATDAFFGGPVTDVYSTSAGIAGTTDDAIYQNERTGVNGLMNYAFPVPNGQYSVVLHFAEIYYTSANYRVFDVSLEGKKVLDDYDIVKKAGAFTAITETFPVNVIDGNLNIDFTSLSADGGADRPAVAAIEILQLSTNQIPIANAGPDKTISAPATSTTLNGSGIDANGSVASFAWTQVSGPNNAVFSNYTVAAPIVSGLVPGTYVFSLIVTDNQMAESAADQVAITVNAAGVVPVYRINAGGGQVANSIGVFAADAFYGPAGSATATHSVSTDIIGTTEDEIYQSDRNGVNGVLNYDFPVSNGKYTVILHFAETYYTGTSNRVFDVSLEGNKVLDNYDIFVKAGANTAISETFDVTVSDGVLNIYFSSLPADGGHDRPKISAIEILGSSTNKPPVANAGPDKTVVLPVSSTTLDGSGTDTDGSVSVYTWTQLSGPNTAAFSSFSVAAPTVNGLIAGSYVFNLTVTDNQQAVSAADQVIVNVSGNSGGSALYRVNAGGGQVSNSIGVFAADGFYSPTPGDISGTSAGIAGTTDDAMYQTVRYSNSGILNYDFPVTNGSYTVILHFAEIYFTAPNNRVFDVTVENSKVLDNYDIYKKAGANTAIAESFAVNVTDGALNIRFSSLTADGGINNPMVSAIEIIKSSGNVAPVANAGVDKEITLPVSSSTLNGSATDTDGSIGAYAWSQVSGPNTATFSSKTVAAPTVSGLIAGQYIFSLVVTDNQLAQSAADQVTVTVNAAGNSPVYRVNAGGGTVTNSIGVFEADKYFSPSPGNVASTNAGIAGTTEDVIYQTQRFGATGIINYAFPVTNGQYKVILHFAEIYFSGVGNRVFDVSLENTKVLDNYDIVKKVGANTATTESFTVNVSDGTLNIYFSSLAADGGQNSPNISAIEIIKTSGAQSIVTEASTGKTTGSATASERQDNSTKLAVRVRPNPTTTYFTLHISSGNSKTIFLRIFGADGRLIESRSNITANSTIQLGTGYIPGLYYAEVLQGKEKVALKFIKLKN